MKLYTEEQVKKLINGYYDINWIIQDAFDELTPIELPSDEEIEERKGFEYPSIQQDAFVGGAKWMRDKILNK